MRLGVISDTHDRIPMIEAAVDFFNNADLTAVLHCGDFVSPFALLPYIELKPPLYAVFGNNDGEKPGIASLFHSNGWTLNDRPWFFELQGKSIAMLHEPDGVNDLAENGKHDLIVFGHTHKRIFEKNNGTLVVNPGEGCGWVSGEATAAIVDLDKRECSFKELSAQ